MRENRQQSFEDLERAAKRLDSEYEKIQRRMDALWASGELSWDGDVLVRGR